MVQNTHTHKKLKIKKKNLMLFYSQHCSSNLQKYFIFLSSVLGKEKHREFKNIRIPITFTTHKTPHPLPNQKYIVQYSSHSLAVKNPLTSQKPSHP